MPDPDPTAQLWLVRHGETEWSAAGRHTSHTDLDLTAAGVADARAVGKRLAGLGFRVLEYGSKGLKEVGAFVDEGGSNFWGVEIHEIDGKQYVLGSDRDYGLYIFDPQS